MGEEDKKRNTIEFRAPEPGLYLYKLESGFSAEPKGKAVTNQLSLSFGRS